MKSPQIPQLLITIILVWKTVQATHNELDWLIDDWSVHLESRPDSRSIMSF